jgi:hypothetical protein
MLADPKPLRRPHRRCGLARVDAAVEQAAEAVGVGAALADRCTGAVDGLVGDGGRREEFVVGGRVVAVGPADARLVALAEAEVHAVEVVGAHAHVAVQLEQLELPQPARLGGHRLDRLQRGLVLGGGLGGALFLLLAAGLLRAGPHAAHAAHAAAHAAHAAHRGLRVGRTGRQQREEGEQGRGGGSLHERRLRQGAGR